MADRPFDGDDTPRQRPPSIDIEKKAVIDSPFGVKERPVVADRLARKLSARQVQMIGWSKQYCLFTEPLLIMIL
jgi:hypothetical protein